MTIVYNSDINVKDIKSTFLSYFLPSFFIILLISESLNRTMADNIFFLIITYSVLISLLLSFIFFYLISCNLVCSISILEGDSFCVKNFFYIEYVNEIDVTPCSRREVLAVGCFYDIFKVYDIKNKEVYRIKCNSRWYYIIDDKPSIEELAEKLNRCDLIFDNKFSSINISP